MHGDQEEEGDREEEAEEAEEHEDSFESEVSESLDVDPLDSGDPGSRPDETFIANSKPDEPGPSNSGAHEPGSASSRASQGLVAPLDRVNAELNGVWDDALNSVLLDVTPWGDVLGDNSSDDCASEEAYCNEAEQCCSDVGQP